MARCASTGWQLGLPLAVAPTAAVLVRRGQPVQVVAEGSGYRVSIDGVAEGEGRAGGLVRVRNVRTGRKFLAAVGPDGRLLLARAAGGA
jgi:flagella basal body P-ring formation protein FlgA